MHLKERRYEPRFGPELLAEGVRFRLFAPSARSVELRYGLERALGGRRALEPGGGDGWFSLCVRDAGPGTRYAFRIDDGELLVPDPASRAQPDGVHAPSEVVDLSAFAWPSETRPLPAWSETVFYELHVGTFTPEGTFRAASGRFGELAALGVTALELMPLAAFPGTRDWGYDGVLPFAPAACYGSPHELQALVAAAHAHGLAVYLDVVYNHFGPEGNYLHRYAQPFFDATQRTPWGDALDFLGPRGAEVRAFFIDNALFWLHAYRFDGLRLDAVHAISDGPQRRLLRELGEHVEAAFAPTRAVALVLENDENERLPLGFGFRAQWNDDVHHALHVLLTGERDGYYADFADAPERLLARALASGFAFQGEPSPFRGGRARGSRSDDLPLASFVNFLQNHDQIGNRAFGERVAMLAPPEAVRAAHAVLLLAPSPPLLFMGEEWGASAPFLYFCDFEPALARAVGEGRRAEFAAFAAFADPAERARIPEPSAPVTYIRSTLDWSEREREPHRSALAFVRELLVLRRRELARRIVHVRGTQSEARTFGRGAFAVRWQLDDGARLALEANLAPTHCAGFAESPPGRVLFATHRSVWPHGSAPPWSVRWRLE